VNPRSLVQPLDAKWQGVLDGVLRSMQAPALADVSRLAPKLVELSQAYNLAQAEGRRTRLPLEARIAFSFPRDVPKGAGAVRELVASGVLAIPQDRPLRVLDLGAGLGAMTWGLVRALATSGASGRIEALLVDEDEAVLAKALAIGRAAHTALGAEPIDLAIETRTQSLAAVTDRPPPGGPWDVVFLGQVLSEIDPSADPAARIEAQVALIEKLNAKMVASGGSLVIVEPALRDRTRHLHALRDRVLERAAGSVNVFAPCLHAASCPMLAIETEWCHEDLPIDLPPWVVPLARAAGLRWQGLTFSYLVLRKDGARPHVPATDGDWERVRFRAVSDLLRSKGKVELFVCTEDGSRQRIRRLDRDAASEQGLPFDGLHRGDIVTLSSGSASSQDAAPTRPIDERGRVQAGAHVAIDVGAARK
jgi:ribosomal protein RSM22 (predicted rRNA methylase)